MKNHHSKKSARFNASIVRFGAFIILALLAAALLPGLAHNPEILLGIGIILPIGKGLKFLDYEGRSGGGSLDDEGQWRAEVLKLITDAQTENRDEDIRARQFALALAGLDTNIRRAKAARALATIQSDEVLNNAFNLKMRSMFRSSSAAMEEAAMKFQKSLKSAMGRKGLDTASTPGSTFVNAQLISTIYDALGTYGAWSTLDVVPVKAGSVKVPVKTARPQAGWIEEGEPIPEDENAAGTAPVINIKKAAVLLYVTRELLEDSEADLTGSVLVDFMEALSERLDWSFFRADGTADQTDGGFSGIFHSGTAAVAAGGNTTVEELQYEDVLRVLTVVKPAVLNRKARWWIHPTMLVRICAIKDNAGRPVFMPYTAVPSPGAIGSLLGYPVEMSFIAPNTNAAGQPVAAFGDPRAYAVGVRRDIELEASEHFKWNSMQVAFRGIARAGGVMRDAECFAVLKTAEA